MTDAGEQKFVRGNDRLEQALEDPVVRQDVDNIRRDMNEADEREVMSDVPCAAGRQLLESPGGNPAELAEEAGHPEGESDS